MAPQEVLETKIVQTTTLTKTRITTQVIQVETIPIRNQTIQVMAQMVLQLLTKLQTVPAILEVSQQMVPTGVLQMALIHMDKTPRIPGRTVASLETVPIQTPTIIPIGLEVGIRTMILIHQQTQLYQEVIH